MNQAIRMPELCLSISLRALKRVRSLAVWLEWLCACFGCRLGAGITYLVALVAAKKNPTCFASVECPQEISDVLRKVNCVSVRSSTRGTSLYLSRQSK